MGLHAVSSKADLRGKRGTFIYDMTACRELVLVTDADGSDLPPQNPDAKPPVPPDPVNIDALSRKLSRMLGRGTPSHLCLLRMKMHAKSRCILARHFPWSLLSCWWSAEARVVCHQCHANLLSWVVLLFRF